MSTQMTQKLTVGQTKTIFIISKPKILPVVLITVLAINAFAMLDLSFYSFEHASALKHNVFYYFSSNDVSDVLYYRA